MRYFSPGYSFIIQVMLLISCISAGAVKVTDYSQPYMEQSLGSNDMTAITQDSAGFIWVATHNELARFDGYSFVPVPSDLSSEIFRGGNLVNAMRATAHDTLLIGTSRGLFIYDIRDGRLIHAADSDSLKIFAIEQSIQNSCWLMNSDKGLLRYDSVAGKLVFLREYMPVGDVPLTSLKSFQMGQDSCLYFSDSRYLMKMSQDMSRTDTLRVWKGDSWRAEVHPPHMFLYDRKRLVVSDMSGCHSERVSDIEVTDICLWDGAVIFGIRGKGIEKVTYSKDGRFVHENVRLSRYYDDMSGTVNAFFEDSDGNLWVATRNGLFLMSRQEKSQFSNVKSDIGHGENNALSHNTVSDILVENDDRIWLATAGGLDLLTFDESSDNGYTVRHFRDNAYQKNNDYHKIEQLCADAGNEIWCGTKAGMLFFDLESCSFRSHPEIETAFEGCSFIRAIWRDSYDDMWVGFENGGLFRYRAGKKQVENVGFSFGGGYFDNCTSVCEDRDGHIWVGTKGNSLFRIDFTGREIASVKQYLLSPETNPASARITYIYLDLFGNIWVGTADGMYRYAKDMDEFDRIELGEPASRPYICGIIGDDDGNLWIPTVSGIFKYSMWNGAGTAFYRRSHFARYGFVFGCAKGSDGFIYLSGINGLTWFYPEDITSDCKKYDITLLDFKADGVSSMSWAGYPAHETEDRKIVLPYRQNRISFSFSVLDYAHRSEIQYSYMLDGSDDDWIYPASEPRNISYGHLKPGLYTLKMRSTDRSGIWQDNGRVLYIRVRPPVLLSWYSISAYLIILAGTAYMLMCYFRKKAKEKTDAILHMQRMQFYKDISYNMKNPVTLIESPLQKLLAGFGKLSWSQEKNLLETIHRGCVSISMLAEQLSDFSEIDSGSVRLNLTMVDFMQFSSGIYEKFRPLFERKGISSEFISESKPVFMSFDKGRIERVFYELLSNAYKFTPSGGHVICACRKDRNGFVRVEISDSGEGVAPEKLERIFDRFWTDGGQQSGSGMGLPLARESVVLHGGSMEAQSIQGKGLSIFFTIPVHDGSIAVSEPSGDNTSGMSAHLSEYMEVMESGTSSDKHASPGAPLVFIVSKDKELRKFLAGILMPGYNVETFPSPDSVFGKISQELPSLVISGMVFNDGKEGLKLCQQVKSSVRTAHIPFMFLTAYSQDRLRKDGYESGADAYVTKPFEVDYLLVRINRLIKSREAIRAKARREIIANPAEVDELSADDKFLAKATVVVERNLSNEDFSVDTFAKEMCTSSSMLYRRIKFLTNSSPNEFIRSIRMKRAAQLLKIHACSVSEVAFRVGFGDARYFSTCFKKEFGRTPTAWQQENSEVPKDLSR